ncbi:IbrB-like domain-containing protein [Streptomyces nanshensis]|uniref:IbrB-like domain-containing protein n=1 Tax=Streptomyces nanshensis TaxID=518642 RepID=UPI000A4FB360|nr:ParB/RepB/Spo0J family partition protein [Streptomyces nanshensis]
MTTTARSGKFVSPVYDVRAVPLEKVRGNLYNPNSVAPPELDLLEVSIWEDGITQPVVAVHDAGVYEVVDGYHRYLTVRDVQRIRDREDGMLPVVVLEGKSLAERMASTIRHNRARGVHDDELMAQIVGELADSGMRDDWIRRQLGMSQDEVSRLRAIVGVQKVKKLTARRPADTEDDAAPSTAPEVAVQQKLFAPGGWRSPVYGVQAVPLDLVRANAYNPNVVKPREMRLLEISVWEDGLTQPVVVYFDEETGAYEVVDGYHRYLTVRDVQRIRDREEGMLPVVVLPEADLPHRMASTIRHNRARGAHDIRRMSSIVRSAAAGYTAATGETIEGKSDAWMMKNFGMGAEELLNMKDPKPLASAYSDREFSEVPDAAV